MPNRNDLRGVRFGRLVAIEFSTRGRASLWRCRCDCGKEKLILASSLQQGRTGSCGCFHRANATRNATKHGHSDMREYTIWKAMKGRCVNPNGQHWLRYGGRGISVCERWRDSFDHFLADMGEAPSKKHSIDRIDNDGNYEPSNCRWATQQVQVRNSRKAALLTVNGETQCVAEWAARFEMPYTTIIKRRRAGLSGDEIFRDVPRRVG